jgi:putative hydrolase of the HAD superfamily
MNIRAVIFDRDNTLLHFDPTAVTAIEARIAEVAPTLPPSAVSLYWTMWPGPWPRTAHAEPAFWRAFWDGLARQYQLPQHEITALEQIGTFYHTCFAAFPDASACLAQLRARSLRLAVLTNFELPSVDLTLQHAGLDSSLFDVLLSSASIGFHKPDPRAYLAVADALHLPASECAFVDDLPENVEAARALGMTAWLLDREYKAGPGLTFRIHNLYDLANLLRLPDEQMCRSFEDNSTQTPNIAART